MYRHCQLKYVAEFYFEHSVIWCWPNCWVRDFRTLPCLKFIKLCRVFTGIQCRVFKHYTWYIFIRLISVFLSLVYSFRYQSDFVCVFLLIAVRAWRSLTWMSWCSVICCDSSREKLKHVPKTTPSNPSKTWKAAPFCSFRNQ